MPKIIGNLDALYQRTLDGDVSAADRKAVVAAMEIIVAKCNDFLTNAYQISPELRSRFRKLRDMCLDEIRGAEAGHDVLIHWCLARDLMLTIQKAFDKPAGT